MILIMYEIILFIPIIFILIEYSKDKRSLLLEIISIF